MGHSCRVLLRLWKQSKKSLGGRRTSRLGSFPQLKRKPCSPQEEESILHHISTWGAGCPGQKGCPWNYAGYKQWDSLCLQRAEKHKWKWSSLLWLHHMPAPFSEVPQRWKERKKPVVIQKSLKIFHLNNELMVGLANSVRSPFTILPVCALFSGPTQPSAEKVHLSQQYVVNIARVK